MGLSDWGLFVGDFLVSSCPGSCFPPPLGPGDFGIFWSSLVRFSSFGECVWGGPFLERSFSGSAYFGASVLVFARNGWVRVLVVGGASRSAGSRMAGSFRIKKTFLNIIKHNIS